MTLLRLFQHRGEAFFFLKLDIFFMLKKKQYEYEYLLLNYLDIGTKIHIFAKVIKNLHS